ncbi:MAG: helix-turn-helix transcriptional regulator [Actinomycetota bacterium]|nr:helix-turn-helix transcriptional regulator [Actinomycetota bacterium]
MHLRCRLRALRADRPVKEIAAASKINRAVISQLERGVLVPLEKWIPGLERAYGRPVEDWYPRDVLLAVSRGDS